ncbi:MAG: SgcJ/EcaC family oxidoreductase [Acidobacteria bacterium]|nr:SgcJ/EcaC family oxidoreductase [Acidobacteriota bacterium]
MRSTGENTNGAFGLMEHWMMPPGFASPYHTHHREDEAFYVLEGEVAFVCDGKWLKGGPGTYAFGPRGIPHGFKIVGSVPARMLLLCAPGGFEHFLLEQATPIADPPSAPDMAKLMELAAKFQIDIHGPLPEEPVAGIGASKSDVEVIEAIRQRHVAALNARDAVAWAGVFTEDAVQMPPNFPANSGRANIQAWSAGFLGAMSRVQFSLSVSELKIAGDQAIEVGAYAISFTPEGGQDMQDAGKYITIYQRVLDGGWAVGQDIWNSDRS